MIYDIFYISKEKINEIEWKKFRSRFPSAQKIENVTTIDDVKKKAFTKFFWLVWDDVAIADNFNFDYRIDKWSEEYVHVWKNSCNGVASYISGVALIPKNAQILKKEFDFKFYVNKKEIDLVASKYQYPIRTIDTYKEYIDVMNKNTKSMIWCVRSDIIITDTTVFDVYFDPLDGKYDYDRAITHVFKNDKFYDGLMLLSKNKILTEKEFKFRFPIEKKEWDIVISNPIPYDIIFISYNELNADENYRRLLTRFPKAKRIHGVKGIHQAHIAAANLSETEMFWVVDGDAVVAPDFNFTIKYYSHYDSGNRREHINTVYVWHSKNPINGLVYGNGGVKLLPKTLTMNMDTTSVDMTLAISNRFKIMPMVSNYNMFNTDEFTTWRSAFRECVKLSTKVIDEKYDTETDDRLNTWCTKGAEKPFGKYAIAGANAGVEFGLRFVGLDEILSKINDFTWLKDEFKKWKLTNE